MLTVTTVPAPTIELERSRLSTAVLGLIRGFSLDSRQGLEY